MLHITNSKEINEFMLRHVCAGRTLYPIKGQAPEGATYRDGTPVTRPVNIAWTESETGERIDVVWGENPGGEG